MSKETCISEFDLHSSTYSWTSGCTTSPIGGSGLVISRATANMSTRNSITYKSLGLLHIYMSNISQCIRSVSAYSLSVCTDCALVMDKSHIDKSRIKLQVSPTRQSPPPSFYSHEQRACQDRLHALSEQNHFLFLSEPQIYPWCWWKRDM